MMSEKFWKPPIKHAEPRMGDSEEAKLEGSDVVFPTKIMNEHLICSLCMGYLRDAQTVTECLHTFCKVCIIQHLGEYAFCPTCEVNLGTAPKEKIRADRAMQNIVDKVFPHFVREEAAAEKTYKAETESGGKNEISESSAQSEAKRKKVCQSVAMRRKNFEKESSSSSSTSRICLSLFPASVDDSSKVAPKLPQPYLRSSVDATVKQYKLYLSKRLEEDRGVKAAQHEIHLSVQGVELKNEMTIGEVWKEMWGVEEDLAVEYSIKR